MLRTLGIAFIGFAVCFVGFVCLAIGFWAIHSGFVVFPGLQRTAVTIQTAEPALHNERPDAGAAHTESSHRPIVSAENRASARILPAGFTTMPGGAAAAFDPADEDPLAILRAAQLISVQSAGGSGTDFRWDLSGNNRNSPLLFPSDTQRVTLEFTIRGLTNAVVNALKTQPTGKDSISNRVLLAGDTAIVGTGDTLTIQYNLAAAAFASAAQEIGLSDGSGTMVRVQRLSAATGGKLKINYVFNGPRQAGNPPAPYSTDTVPLFGSYLRVQYFSVNEVEPWFFIINDSSSTSTAHRVRPSRIRLPASDTYEALFTSADQLAGISNGGNGRLFIAVPDSSGGSDLILSSTAISLERGAPTTLPPTPSLTLTGAGSATVAVRNGIYYLGTGSNTATISMSRSALTAESIDLFLYSDLSESTNLLATRLPGSGTLTAALTGKLSAGRQNLIAAVYQGGNGGAESSLPIHVLDGHPSVTKVDASNFSSSGNGTITLQFDMDFPLDPIKARERTRFELRQAAADNASTALPQLLAPEFDADTNRVTLSFSRDLPPGNYKLTVRSSVADIAGNTMTEDSTHEITRSTFDSPPSETRGIGTASTGKYVPYPEYTPPRQMTSGFNPSDKVVTRMVRLYYFRDAHRIAQIVNRKVTSYNRATVDMKQQFADASRREADTATDQRRELESAAVRAAQQARAAEEALEEQQTALMTARANRSRLEQQVDRIEGLRDDLSDDAAASGTPAEKQETLRRQYDRELTRLQRDRDRADLEIMDIESRVRTLLSRVQSERTVEIQKTEAWERAEAEERRKAEETFRREVAAKTADPDTYAPGVVKSDDPVEQVSISVVGEGLIQLRGPRKGVNEVHKMINQLDGPVGQVKVGIHTVQVNGDNGERMEKVVSRIQRYLDHSRFLTMQSAEMLRNSVVAVASRQASMVADLCPPGTPQQVRDYKYQEAFFGAEFIQELRTLDSEFLKTGNKLLSLHSMDTTSLSNALFLMALAKNDVRQQILQEFLARVQYKLPQDELEFFQASGAEFKFRKKEFQFLGHNAHFASLRGIFDAEVTGTDTLNPMQREFIRLAQIFKGQLVTEIELRQRVMERALIEEKIGDYTRMLEEAKRREDEAAEQKAKSRAAVNESAENVRSRLMPVRAVVQEISTDSANIASRAASYADARYAIEVNVVERVERLIRNYEIRNQRAILGELDREAIGQFLFPDLETQLADYGLTTRVMSLFEIASSADYVELRDLRNGAPLSTNVKAVLSKWHNAYSTLQSNHGKNAEEDETLAKNLQRTGVDLYRKFLQEVDLSSVSIVIEINDKKFQAEWNPSSSGRAKSDPMNITDDTPLSRVLPEGVTISPQQSFRHELVTIRNWLKDTAEKRLLQFALSDGNRTLMRRASQAIDEFDAYYKNEGSSENLAGNGDLDIKALEKLILASSSFRQVAIDVERRTQLIGDELVTLNSLFSKVASQPEQFDELHTGWVRFRNIVLSHLDPLAPGLPGLGVEEGSQEDSRRLKYNRFQASQMTLQLIDDEISGGSKAKSSALLDQIAAWRSAEAAAKNLRRPLDHKKFLDMLVDDVEEKYIELVEGTRAHTSNIDNYLKRLGTALEDDLNAQFYHPAFRYVRETSYFYDVQVGQVETTSVVANNRMFAKVSPQATMEFDLPKRNILINEAMSGALAAYNDYGALIGDPNFQSLMRLYGGQSPSATFGGNGSSPYVQQVLPGLPSDVDARLMTSAQNNVPRIGSSLEALIPDPAVYKFETGTGYEIRPVIQPDGQAVVFHLDYMYSTNIREPVRADEKHLGRVRRHFINTDVVSGNYELREVSTYRVGLKAARTSRGVPLLEDVPGLGVLFRPLPSAESSLQQNIILSQTVIYPTLFDLMGLRWAPAVADLDTLTLREREFVTRNREKVLRNEVFDYSSLQVDEFMRVPEAERRGDLYRTQESIPMVHPNGYQGDGLNLKNGTLREGYAPEQFQQPSGFIPNRSEEAIFPLEPTSRSPVLMQHPGMQAPDMLVPGVNGDVRVPNGLKVPGTNVPVDSIEGAVPLNAAPVPCPPNSIPEFESFRGSSINLRPLDTIKADADIGSHRVHPVSAAVQHSPMLLNHGDRATTTRSAARRSEAQEINEGDRDSLMQRIRLDQTTMKAAAASKSPDTDPPKKGFSKLIPGFLRR